jgi:serine/threonine protein kinase/Tfp pilus assembly protein PilF
MPDPFHLEREIFAAALDCPTPAERDAYLDAACGSDAALRARVDNLLRAHAAAGRFMEGSSSAPETASAEAPLRERPGTRIDRYRLIEQIGEGGFGVVYRAEQETPLRRIVALKIIKLGMDTRAVLARFDAERQALALMDHPGIAKVLDGGTSETGRPYFVMELVPGVPITKFCAEHRLTTRERIELFMQVCDAVQHAHQKGIVHRDLKPSNILVAAGERGPIPKVIDFGIAKATQQPLTEHTLFSRLHPFIGTPAYMSPEQAGGDGADVDTRSDLYSLGVLLYELLTDQTPFENESLLRAGYAAIQRAIREEEPPAPSRRLASLDRHEQTTAAQRRRLEPARLASQLRGDLDRIVLKCLEKERARRYDTSSALAADLARHLNNEPVLARPDTLAYRTGKFLRRHARAVVTATAAAIALAVFVVYHTAQLTAERDRARHEADKATSLSRLLTDLWTAADPYRTRDSAEPTVRTVLDAGARHVRETLAAQPALQAEMFTVIGRVYQRLGLLHEARPLLEDAVKLGRPLPDQPQLLASTLNDLGVLFAQRGDYDAAEPLLTEALALRRRAPGADADVAITLVELGRVHVDRGAPHRAEPLLREALSIRRKVLGSSHRETATSLSDLGLLLWETGDLTGAEAHLRECWEISKQSLGEGHPDVGTALANTALIVLHRGDRPAAEKMFREALVIRRNGLGPTHPALATTLNNLAHALREQARFDEAQAAVVEAIEITRAALGDEHPRIAAYTAHLAQIYLERGDAAHAEPLARAALVLRQRVSPGDAWRIAATQSLLGAALAALARYDEAEPLLLEADRVLQDIPGPQGRETAAHRERLTAFREARRLAASETSESDR